MKSNQNQSIPDLTPCSDNPILQKLHQERAEHEKEVKRLNNELRMARNELFSTRQRLRVELVKAHQEKFDSFYNQLMNLKSVELMLWEEYHLHKHILLQQLRNQQIDNSTYRRTLRPYNILRPTNQVMPYGNFMKKGLNGYLAKIESYLALKYCIHW